MNKKQQRTENLSRHYFNIAQLYQQTTGKEITQDQAKKISNKLFFFLFLVSSLLF
jgi:hypothetical protein